MRKIKFGPYVLKENTIEIDPPLKLKADDIVEVYMTKKNIVHIVIKEKQPKI